MNEEINITGIEDKIKKEAIISETYLPIKDKKVAISVSTNEDIENLGLSEQHLNDISIEIARYIIANGGTALYGGDLRVNGFTHYFSELANQYKKSNDLSIRFINYFSLPSSKQLDKKATIDFKSKQIGIEIIKPDERFKFDFNKDYNPISNIEDKYIFCECFKAMRIKMDLDSNARIVVGGKKKNFLGFIPGIVEEAIYSIISSKPLYIVGGFGGISKALAEIFEGQNPEELTNDYQYYNPHLKEFYYYASDKYEYSNYENIVKLLQNYSIEKLSEINKLTIEENKILFKSINIHEITYLIMKGIKKACY